MDNLVPTIGLEVHAELKTRTKMFCDSANDPNEERPNVHVCPVCMAHPGTLPVINREAVRHVLRFGAAVSGTLADYTEFDRKNYFYPDLPKGYQISQYEYPLVAGGELAGIRLTRVHLEEDTARSLHDEVTGETLVDYNRAGVPLMELVTEPDIHSAEDAISFARELQLLLRYLGASDANMEKGEMRVEANVSVGKAGGELGTKVEIKNLNSFKAVERAVLYEIERQTELLRKGEVVLQQTLGWDDARQKTFPQRSKEGSADYRYFPDPDLPSLKISELRDLGLSEIERSLPGLPSARRKRYQDLGLKSEDGSLFVSEPALGDLFDAVAEALSFRPQSVLLSANYIANDLVNLLRRDIKERDSESKPEISFTADDFAELIELIESGAVSSRGGKDILSVMFASGGSPKHIAETKGLLLNTSAEATEAIVAQVLAEHERAVNEYKNGKESALQFLVGQAMRLSKGAGDPNLLREAIQTKIASL